MSMDPEHRLAADPDVEQEVDFGRYWRLIATRWWLPVAGLVAGLLIGYVASLGTASQTYEATAEIYLGQPLAPGSATPVSDAPTRLGLVSTLVHSETTARAVAAKVGMKESRLRDHITTKAILGITTNAKVGTTAPLFSITVDGAPPAKVAAAANELAKTVVGTVSRYTNTKIATLNKQLAFYTRNLASVTRRLDVATQQVQTLLAQQGLSGSEKLIASLNLNNLLTYLESRQSSLEASQLATSEGLSLAHDVEQGRIISPAVATKTAGPSSRTGAAIGGLIGLIVGILAALLWDPVAARIHARQS